MRTAAVSLSKKPILPVPMGATSCQLPVPKLNMSGHGDPDLQGVLPKLNMSAHGALTYKNSQTVLLRRSVLVNLFNNVFRYNLNGSVPLYINLGFVS